MTWIKDIVIFSAVMGFIKWIIPSGTFEKYINYIISLLTLAVIMTPLLSQTTAAVYLELPVGAVAGEEETRSNSQSNSIETIQTYQIDHTKGKIRDLFYSERQSFWNNRGRYYRIYRT